MAWDGIATYVPCACTKGRQPGSPAGWAGINDIYFAMFGQRFCGKSTQWKGGPNANRMLQLFVAAGGGLHGSWKTVHSSFTFMLDLETLWFIIVYCHWFLHTVFVSVNAMLTLHKCYSLCLLMPRIEFAHSLSHFHFFFFLVRILYRSEYGSAILKR